MYTRGFFSKQLCCYYCRASQWVYVDESPQMNEYLYTSFGRQAAHRNTSLSLIWGKFWIIYQTIKVFIWRSPSFRNETIQKNTCFFGFGRSLHLIISGWSLSMSGWTSTGRVPSPTLLDGHRGEPIHKQNILFPYTPPQHVRKTFRGFRIEFGEVNQYETAANLRNISWCDAYSAPCPGGGCHHLVPVGLVWWPNLCVGVFSWEKVD